MHGQSAEPDATAARIQGALARLLGDRDYDQILIDEVLAGAAVDHETFKRHFANLDECFMAVWKQVEAEFIAYTMASFEGASGWREGMREAAWATCRFMREDHGRARIIMFRVEVGGEAVRAQRDRLIDLYVELVHAGRFEMDDPEAISRDVAAGITSSIWDRGDTRVRAGEFEAMAADVPDFLYLTFLPYLGPEVAVAELEGGNEELRRGRRP